MDFESDLLAEPFAVFAQLDERLAHLLDRLLAGDLFVEAVRFHLDPRAADVVAQADEFPGGFQGRGELFRVGLVVPLVAPDADER